MSKEDEKKVATGSSGPGYLEVICIALLIAGTVVAGYDRFLAQKIKVVDLKGYIRTQKALLTAREITMEQLTANLNAVEQILDNEAAANPNRIILLKDVVMRNGEEIRIKE